MTPAPAEPERTPGHAGPEWQPDKGVLASETVDLEGSPEALLKPGELATSPPWQIVVLTEATFLQHELNRIPVERRSSPDWVEAQRQLVRAVRATGRDEQALTEAAYPDHPSQRVTGSTRLAGWWNGSQLETAWGALHAAGELLLMVQDDASVRAQLDDISALVMSNLSTADERTKTFETFIQSLRADSEPLTQSTRDQLRQIRHAANATSDAAHRDARTYRNTLILIAGVLTLVLLSLACVAMLDTGFRPLCGSATGAASIDVCGTRARWSLLEVEAIGSLGGLIAAVFALKSFSGFQDTYSLPFVQAFLKGASGAATGLAGTFLLQSGLLAVDTAQGGVRVFAYAAAFGYSQELFTRVVNQQAGAILTPTRSRNDPATTPAGSPRR